MPKTVEELTVSWVDEDGTEMVRELDKQVLSEGSGWATVAYLFSEIDPDGEVKPPKINLRRYRKRAGAWNVHNKLVLTNHEQMANLYEALGRWLDERVESNDE